MFHISQLKHSLGIEHQVNPATPLIREDGQLLAKHEGVLDRRLVKRGRGIAAEILVKWSNLPAEYATWEDH